MKETIGQKLQKLNIKAKFQEPLSKYTTLRIGGPAEYYIEVRTVDQFRETMEIAKENNVSVFILGWGSNLLVADEVFEGFVVRLKGDFEKMVFEDSVDECIFTAGAGVRLPFLLNRSINDGYSGFEPLAGIPGTVGGALVINAGGKWGTISDCVIDVKVSDFSGDIKVLRKKDITFGYRTSSLEGLIMLEAKFRINKSSKDKVLKKVTGYLKKRAETQPIGTYNAGSIFKNPGKKSAAKLIDECGLKGLKIGGVQVSEKHANFIVNNGKGTADDVHKLISEIKNKVKEKFGISLELEIKLIK